MTAQRGDHTPLPRLVVLGAAGDLVTRHTLAALAHLEAAQLLPDKLDILAVDRVTSTTSAYRTSAAALFDTHAAAVPEAARRRLMTRLRYRPADVVQTPTLSDALDDRPCAVYLALPPDVVPPAVALLRRSSLAPGSRVLVEKPFGTDRASAAALEAQLLGVVEEPDVYRADHFLHHQLLRDVLAVRFESGPLDPLWNGMYVERVDVVWEEATPATGRGAFYDRTGALRDMVQSHLLQLLAAAAMEPPPSTGSSDLRAARADLLARVVPPDPAEVKVRTLRGRYVAGTVRSPGPRTSEEVRPYVEEPGVDPRRLTETYARVDLRIAGARWQGVPFSLRTGRAVGSGRRQVRVRFRGRPEAPGSRSGAGPDTGPASGPGTGPGTGPTLVFDMGGDQPGATRLALAPGAGPGWDTEIFSELSLARTAPRLPASALMLRDLLDGETRWFLSADEVDQSWRVVDAVLDTWRSGVPSLVEYAAGSAGPEPGD